MIQKLTQDWLGQTGLGAIAANGGKQRLGFFDGHPQYRRQSALQELYRSMFHLCVPCRDHLDMRAILSDKPEDAAAGSSIHDEMLELCDAHHGLASRILRESKPQFPFTEGYDCLAKWTVPSIDDEPVYHEDGEYHNAGPRRSRRRAAERDGPENDQHGECKQSDLELEQRRFVYTFLSNDNLPKPYVHVLWSLTH